MLMGRGPRAWTAGLSMPDSTSAKGSLMTSSGVTRRDSGFLRPPPRSMTYRSSGTGQTSWLAAPMLPSVTLSEMRNISL